VNSISSSAEPILAVLPDIPRWVEARGMLLSRQSDLLARGIRVGDFIVRARSQPLIVIVGKPPLGCLLEVSERPEVGVVLCAPEEARDVESVLPSWKKAGAILHCLSAKGVPDVASPRDAEIGILPAKEAPEGRLIHLPDRLRREIADALPGGHVTAAFVDGKPVAFCYPVYETETLWDISVDTVEPHRRRGLAAACVAFLIDHMERHGKEPVWGALEENIASLALAKRLGFEPVDRMIVFLRS
jgi:GNAT superfamily N-acetyltransferase